MLYVNIFASRFPSNKIYKYCSSQAKFEKQNPVIRFVLSFLTLAGYHDKYLPCDKYKLGLQNRSDEYSKCELYWNILYALLRSMGIRDHKTDLQNELMNAINCKSKHLTDLSTQIRSIKLFTIRNMNMKTLFFYMQ